MPRFLAIDWDGEEVRFVLCVQNQKDVLRISKIGSEKIGNVFPSSPESTEALKAEITEKGAAPPPAHNPQPAIQKSHFVQVGEALHKVLKEHQIASASKTLFAMSGCNTNSMYFALPPAKPEEIPEMLKNQAVRDMPNFQEIHPIDFLRLNENIPGPQKVLAVSLSRIDLKAIQNIGKAIHNKPTRIEYRGAATASFLLGSGLLPPDSPPTLLVNLFADELDLIAVAEQKIVYIRSVKLPSAPDAGETPAVPGNEKPLNEKLYQEIVRTCTVGLQEVSEDVIESLIFLGIEEEQSELIERLRQHSLDVLVLNPLTLAQVQDEQMPEHPGRFAALLGMIQSEVLGKKPEIDILHPKSKPQPPNYAGIVLLLVLLLALALGGVYQWNRQALKKMELELAGLKKDYDRIYAEHNVATRPWWVLSKARQFDQTDAIWLDVVRDIGPAIPEQQDMIIQRMSFISGPIQGNRLGAYYSGQIVVDALVRDPSVVAQLKKTLEAKGRGQMYNVMSQTPRHNPTGGGFPWTYRFTIACRKIANPNLYLYYLPAQTPSETGVETPRQ